MFTRKSLLVLSSALAFIFAQAVIAQEGPGLGVPISEEDLAPWDISIETDGGGLPAGSGTPQQGEVVYNNQCLACHGEEGGGQPYDRLVGGHDTIGTMSQVQTIGSYWPNASTAFDYIRRAMPFNTPQTLSDDEVYAVTAYILYLNGIIEENATLNADSLSEVVMPNADGFIMSYP